MNKSSTSSLAAQTQRMAFKRQSEHLKSEVVAGTGLNLWEAQVLLDVIERIYWSDPELKPCKEGQLRITCVAAHARILAVLEQKEKLSTGGYTPVLNSIYIWRPQGDLNPCRRRERAVSWARLDDGDARI